MKLHRSCLSVMLSLLLLAASCLSLSACSQTKKTYTVGICQLVQHDALDAATQGLSGRPDKSCWAKKTLSLI